MSSVVDVVLPLAVPESSITESEVYVVRASSVITYPCIVVRSLLRFSAFKPRTVLMRLFFVFLFMSLKWFLVQFLPIPHFGLRCPIPDLVLVKSEFHVFYTHA
jgi:hypothetical protein